MAERERLRQVMETMQSRLKGGARVDRREFFKMCLVLSRVMDCVMAANQTPHCVHDLVQLLKHVCSQKGDVDVRPAIVTLMLSFKGAGQAGWFTNVDTGDLFSIVNRLLDFYESLDSGSLTDSSDIEKLTADVLARLYPWLKVDSVLLYFDAEAGYRTLLSEFYIHKAGTVLFTIRRDLVEQPACLVHATLANFMVNGYAIDKRTALQVENGPQPPADCTRYCKPGNNILQVVGEFPATYAVIMALTANVTLEATLLDLPETQILDTHTDDDVMEGPSKVSLCCPLSRQRIATPVKGLDCKHMQCFDYENYMKINMRRPSWRCPYCNNVVTLQQLRVVRKMAEILDGVDVNVKDVMLSINGTWEVLEPNHTESKTKKSATVIVDLTQAEYGDSEALPSPRQAEGSPTRAFTSIPGFSTSLPTIEDRKPDISSIWTISSTVSALSSSRSLSGNLTSHMANGPELRQQTPRARLRLSHQDTDRLYHQLSAVHAQQAIPQQRVALQHGHSVVQQTLHTPPQTPQTPPHRTQPGAQQHPHHQTHRALPGSQQQPQMQQIQQAHRVSQQQTHTQQQQAHRAQPGTYQEPHGQSHQAQRLQQEPHLQQHAQVWQTQTLHPAGFSPAQQQPASSFSQQQVLYAQQAQFSSHRAPAQQQCQQFQGASQGQQVPAAQVPHFPAPPQFQLQPVQQSQSAVFALQQQHNRQLYP